MSWPPTLADDAAALQTAKVDPDLPDSPTVTVEAPCCGRTCAADMVVDLRGVPGTVIKPRGVMPQQDVEWACDACRHRVVGSKLNKWTESQLVRGLGAPAEAVRRKRAREELWERRRTMASDEAVQPRAFMETRIRDMRESGGMPRATDPPVED